MGRRLSNIKQSFRVRGPGSPLIAVSIAQQGIAPTAAGHRRAALVPVQTKFHRIARSGSDIPLAPPTSHAPQRPDSTILNEAIPLFAIGRNKAGLWVARDCDSPVGGTFLSKTAAMRFAKRINGPDCALMFVTDGLELDQASPHAAGGPNPVTSPIARAIAATKLRIKRFLLARKNVSTLCDQKKLIEKELYGNRYRHRSKSDDDLPIVR
jgi:hypothetical protein